MNKVIIFGIMVSLVGFFKPSYASPESDATKILLTDAITCYNEIEENPQCSVTVVDNLRAFATEWGGLNEGAILTVLLTQEIDGESGLEGIEKVVTKLSIALLCVEIPEFHASYRCNWADWPENEAKTP